MILVSFTSIDGLLQSRFTTESSYYLRDNPHLSQMSLMKLNA